MLINDELTHSAWHLFYTAVGHYLYEDLDSSCGCITNTLYIHLNLGIIKLNENCELLIICLFDHVIFAQNLDRNKEQFCDLIAINITFLFYYCCIRVNLFIFLPQSKITVTSVISTFSS